MLGDVTETVYLVDEDDEENVRSVKKQSEMLFVRGIHVQRHLRLDRGLTILSGDSVVLISPQQ